MTAQEHEDPEKDEQLEDGEAPEGTAQPPPTAAAPAGPPPLKPFTLEILRIIKDAQQQHGLRHGDYQRYRGYCSRRIYRLRTLLKLPQSDKRHFKRKDVTCALLSGPKSDERMLHIPLFQAERSWAYAMQLKQEANTEHRKKFRLISRLRKASVHALQLQELCDSPQCDARTKLEAQGYVAWICGSLHFELQMWKPAAENVKKAQVVYEKLLATLSEDEQIIYKQKIQELEPSLRYCAYNIGDESAIEDLLQMRGQGMVENLDALMAQARESRAGSLQEVEWRGRRIAVRPERTRLFLLSLQDLDRTLQKASTVTAKIELIENTLMDCKDAIIAIKEEIKLDPKLRSSTGAPLPGVQNLLSYMTYIRLNKTIERNMLLVEQSKEALENKTLIDGKKVRPQDLTRLYEIILQNVTEMQSLAGWEEDAAYQSEIEILAKAYKSFRCFYIAEVLVSLRRWNEAIALYDRADQYANQSIKKLKNEQLCEDLKNLRNSIEAYKCKAHAQSIICEEDEEVVSTGSKKHKQRKPLSERLNDYVEDQQVLTKNPNIYKLPPDMKPVPCKPLFFDLACNFVEFPSLEDKVGGEKKQAAAGLTGFVKGFLGWGGK